MIIKEAIEIVENLIDDLEASDIPIYDNEREALEKLINTAKTIKWITVMGDLNMLFDLDPNRYKINKEDWIFEKGVPFEYVLDKLHEVIKNADNDNR